MRGPTSCRAQLAQPAILPPLPPQPLLTSTGLSPLRDATAAHEILKTMALLKNATKARSPPGDDPSARREETLCLVAGEEETQTEVPWWKKCPLSLLLSAPPPRAPALLRFPAG